MTGQEIEINNIYADSMKIMPKMEPNSVDLILTDIPYGVINRSSNGLRNLDKKDADVVTFQIPQLVKELVRICRGSMYIFCSTEQVSELRKEIIINGLTTRLCIWEKTNPSPMNGQFLWLSGIECIVYARKRGAVFNEHCKNGVFRYSNERNKWHPTQKPVQLLQYLISVSSNKGDTVFDPFMGSGSTGVAAIATGRNFIGIELNEGYYNIAKKEWRRK